MAEGLGEEDIQDASVFGLLSLNLVEFCENLQEETPWMPTFLSRWISRGCNIPNRLEGVVGAYLISLMAEAPKHTLNFASQLSGLHKAQFSRLLANHRELAVNSLTQLSMAVARQAAAARRQLAPATKWRVLLIVDATLHRRSSLWPSNSLRK